MSLSSSLVGTVSRPVRRTWTADDAMLYAIAVGAGQDDPQSELEFTTENTQGVVQKVLPSFVNVAMNKDLELPADLDFAKMLHAEQSFEVNGIIPADGEVESVSEIVGVHDKGTGALISTETRARGNDGASIALLRTSVFFQGYGGFGGDRGPKSDWELPNGYPDHVITYATRTDQALLYRLTGDRNPLHTDPSFSARGGFSRPIMHGMCTYGFTGRALLHAIADSDPSRFRAMSGRFTKPVLPGDSLTVSIWRDGKSARFRTTDSRGAVVIDHGSATIS